MTAGSFDQARVEAAVRELLLACGEDPDRDGLRQTPARVARALQEQFAGLHTNPDEVLNTSFDENHAELVLVRDIPMYSTCEHHLVPFFGRAHVGYIPGRDGRITGLSKLARVVDGYARRPQVQERLTTQIAEALVRRLDPAGVIVVLEAEHLCMAMRGHPQAGHHHHHLRGAWNLPDPGQHACRGDEPHHGPVTSMRGSSPTRWSHGTEDARL